jgi:hypothetical protein
MNVVHFSALIALACLSLFHAILAPVIFDELAPRVVWYLGVDFGVAGVLAVNVIVARLPPSGDVVPWRICHALNMINLAYALFYVAVVPDPGTAIAAIVDVAVLVGGVLTQRRLTTEYKTTQYVAGN